MSLWKKSKCNGAKGLYGQHEKGEIIIELLKPDLLWPAIEEFENTSIFASQNSATYTTQGLHLPNKTVSLKTRGLFLVY